MKFKDLKRSAETIQMSEEMQARIIQNCRGAAVHETEELPMKNRIHFTKAMSIAAVLALCLCASAAAASHFGFFRDVTNGSGAVTGTEYVQAADELAVSAAVEQGHLILTAALLTPHAAPYRELEALGVGRYQITDASGHVILDGEGGDPARITDGKAVMTLSLDGIAPGAYTLRVSTLVGSKKADQPLPISGEGSCAFTI